MTFSQGPAEDAGKPELFRYELKAPKEDICYMSWTIDAYEGMGFLRTDDPSGLVSILFASGWREEVERLLSAFESEGIAIERGDVVVETL
ncbi:MAG: DUF4911 domain-containing protein [Synergistaceae bacterium]|nr:DUF4911 domain-containing protein [Synergistaceae bacterium]